jgi:hypothetical protein
MSDRSKLIGLAYITKTEDPLKVFADIVCFCLYKLGEGNRSSQSISEKVSTEFGFKMPAFLVENCINYLKKGGFISIRNNKIHLNKSSINISEFEHRRSIYQENEEKVLNCLVNYARNQGIFWSAEEARSKLEVFLIDKENVYELFTNNIGDVKRDSTETDIVLGFISDEIQNDTMISKYIIQIANGLVMYIGISVFENYDSEKRQKYQDTDFFLDTKLLLRYLSYSFDFEHQYAVELISLLVNEYNANIRVFRQTYEELRFAFQQTIESLKENSEIFDNEMKYYVYAHNMDYQEIELELFKLDRKLEEAGIKVIEKVNWNDPKVQMNNLNWEQLHQYIKSRNPTWRDKAIHNDIESINQINYLRDCDYSTHFGGSRKLPVFVTSNTKLVAIIKQYLIDQTATDRNVKRFSEKNLPIISCNNLMYRLWLLKPEKIKTLPKLTLSRMVFATHNEPDQVLEEIRRSIKNFSLNNDINLIEMDDYTRYKFENSIQKEITTRPEANITEIIGATIDEMRALDKMASEKKIKAMEEELAIKDKDNLESIKARDLLNEEKLKKERKILDIELDLLKERTPVNIRIIVYIAKHIHLFISLAHVVLSTISYWISQNAILFLVLILAQFTQFFSSKIKNYLCNVAFDVTSKLIEKKNYESDTEKLLSMHNDNIKKYVFSKTPNNITQ